MEWLVIWVNGQMNELIKQGIFKKGYSKVSRLYFICLEAKENTDEFQVRKLNIWTWEKNCLHFAEYVITKNDIFFFCFPQRNRVGGKAVFFIFNTRWHCCFLTAGKIFDLRSRWCTILNEAAVTLQFHIHISYLCYIWKVYGLLCQHRNWPRRFW